MYAGANEANAGYVTQGQTLGSSLCEKVREPSAVDQALHRLAEVINHASAAGGVLGERLTPILVPRPTEGRKEGGSTRGASCQLEDRINDLAERVINIGRHLNELRDNLAI